MASLVSLVPDSQSRVDVTCVHGLDEGLDGDLDTLVAGGEEVALPSHSLLLGGEPRASSSYDARP